MAEQGEVTSTRKLDDWPFVEADKKIKNRHQLEVFLASETCNQFELFLSRTSKAVQGKKTSDDVPVSPLLQRLLGVLEEMETWLQEIPPIQQPMRYGNKAFRDYIQRIHDRMPQLTDRLFGNSLPPKGKRELSTYFIESFGNTTRIDYGTGHETNFVAFLFALEILGFVGPNDYPALILKVFNRYINLMRHIQKTYMLEPAGSHGVWSLDDYQFLPFYYGAAQLNGDQQGLTPKAVLQKDIREMLKKDFMYFAAIDFIFEMKTGPFGEHSPILNDMTQVKLWSKLHNGLLRMYKDEVLKKFPIMQHFFFGSIIPFPAAGEGEEAEGAEGGGGGGPLDV